MKAILKVVQQGEAFAVQSQKSEGGQTMRDVVAVSLRFSTREYNGQVYQDILVTDIVLLAHKGV